MYSLLLKPQEMTFHSRGRKMEKMAKILTGICLGSNTARLTRVAPYTLRKVTKVTIGAL